MRYSAEIDNISGDEWSCLLQEFDDANIYQTWSYGSIRWGENNLSHLIIKRGEEVVGGAQVAIKKFPMVDAGIAYIPWGPLWRKKGAPLELKNLKEIIGFLREEYVIKRRLYLRIAPNIIEDQEGDIERLLKKGGFSCKASDRRYRTLVVDLSPAIDNLRKNLDQKWRNMLNQAEKKGLEIVEGVSDEFYGIFMSLQTEMQERKNYAPGVSYQEFREIQRDLPEPLKMRIMLCKYAGEAVSAAIFSGIGDKGIYLLGATGHKGMNMRGSYLLQWRGMQWLKEKGCRWYDLGGINPEKNPGVHHFKAGLSGKDVYHVGIFEQCQSLASYFLIVISDYVRKIFQKVRH